MTNETTAQRYIALERGNGLPSIGDRVILPDDNGWHKLLRVVGYGSGIQTGAPGSFNRLVVECVEAEQSWDDLSEAKQDRLYASLHHVGPVDADDETAD